MSNTGLLNLNTLATNATFTSDAIFIDASCINMRVLLRTYENQLALWARLMNKKETVIKNEAGHLIRVPATIASSVDTADILAQDEPQRLLWFANVGFTPALLTIANDLINNPRRAGVVRLSDELQVIQSEANKVLNPGHTMQESCTWVRSQFWHPQDLVDFRRECQQQLNPDGSNTLEFTWRSFDPDLGMDDMTPGNWLRFSTRYRLYDGGDGDFYQLCDNLGMEVMRI